jgi:hypothetical protein
MFSKGDKQEKKTQTSIQFEKDPLAKHGLG